ncbi:hypothetical protein HKB36_25920 [Vibrio parahaemolyticus]|uniref:hypothetical protein n=1 Tax=Vibrio parahaemolyticus TaxID=670 RepID=UPI00146CAFA1|nr:hypothetical protein [Vibrio parahaemolyticus]MDF5453521.1 hypothetical protein [Vibrio parahaemolyticus]NMS06438.1 hypothetical protein [Vibrio parahaemolyticus]
MSKQITFDPRHMTPEQIMAMSEQALQMQKEFSEKEEKIKETIDILFSLDDEVELQIAVDEVIEFVIKNIDHATHTLRDRLAVVAEREVKEETTDKPVKKRGKNKVTFQLLHLENFKAEAPNLYKYLVENEDAKPLEENPEKLVVRRKAYSPIVKAEAAKDSDKELGKLLDQYAEYKIQIESDNEAVKNPEKQPLSAFDSL